LKLLIALHILSLVVANNLCSSFVQPLGGVRHPHGTCVTNAKSLDAGGRTVSSTNSSKIPQTTPKEKPANVSN
jgi:hypothetical protein